MFARVRDIDILNLMGTEAKKLNVLVVDDHLEACRALVRLLQTSDHRHQEVVSP